MAIQRHPVHYAPHHTGHAPLCGAEKTKGNILLATLDRDGTTCFRCIDAYNETVMTPEQAEALRENSAAIDELMGEMDSLIEAELNALTEQNRAVRRGMERRQALRLIEDLRRFTPWWDLRRQFILFSWRRHVLAQR